MYFVKASITFICMFLVIAFNETFVNCLDNIEIYKFSIEELSVITEIYKEFREIYKDCKEKKEMILFGNESKMEHKSWWNPDLKDIYEEMKFEILCVEYKGKLYKDEDILQLVSIFWVQLQSTKYSYLFASGYIHFQKKINNEILSDIELNTVKEYAENCSYISAYLGAFGLDIDNVKSIAEKYFTYFDSHPDVGNYIDFNEFNTAYIEFLNGMRGLVADCFPEKNQDEFMELSSTPLMALYKRFLKLIFYHEKPSIQVNQEESEPCVDELGLWNSTKTLLHRWRGTKSRPTVAQTSEEEEDTTVTSPCTSTTLPSCFKFTTKRKPKLINLLREIEILKSELQRDQVKTGLCGGLKLDLPKCESSQDKIKAGIGSGFKLDLVPVKRTSNYYLGFVKKSCANVYFLTYGTQLKFDRNLDITDAYMIPSG